MFFSFAFLLISNGLRLRSLGKICSYRFSIPRSASDVGEEGHGPVQAGSAIAEVSPAEALLEMLPISVGRGVMKLTVSELRVAQLV